MSNSLQRYEASVKLSNGRVVVYHNINTGLKKFHRFLCEKFSGENRWITYSVRRKVNKEIIGTFKNSIPSEEKKVVSIFCEVIQADKGNGVFVPMVFDRKNKDIIRNIFVANRLIINQNKILITIPDWLFNKMIDKGIRDLFQYYVSKNHQIKKSDISISKNMYYVREVIKIPEKIGTEPTQDYP